MYIIKPVRRYVDSAEIEGEIVQKIMSLDPHNQSKISLLYDRFMYHHHHKEYYVMVFENLGPSLFKIIKLNRYRGILI